MGAEESSEPEPTEPESFSEEEKLLLQKVFDEGKIEVLLGARQDQLQFYGKHLCGDCHLDIVNFKSKIASLVRSPDSTVLSTCMDALRSGATGADADPPPGESLHVLFFLLLIEFSSPFEELTGEEIVIANKLAAFASLLVPGENKELLKSSFLWEYLPHAARLLSAHYYRVLGLHEVAGASYQPYICPFYTSLNGEAVKDSMIRALALVPLSLYSQGIQGELRQIYSTDLNGFDFLNIQQALMGYEGGTLVLIKASGYRDDTNADSDRMSKSPMIFGAFTDTPWRDQKNTYGSCSGFSFCLEPQYSIIRERKYQYLNTRSFNKLSHGLGLGASTLGSEGTAEAGCSFSVFLPTTLEDCVAFGKVFDVACLEIYACAGCGGVDKGLEGQGLYREQVKVNRERARTVDRAAFFNNEFDREMFLGKTFAHRAQAQDRE